MKAYEIREDDSWDLTDEYYIGEIVDFTCNEIGTVAIIRNGNNLLSRYIAEIKVSE